MTEKIHLRAVTPNNYRDIIKLKVSPNQEHLVAPNLHTITQMQFKHEKTALGFYLGEVAIGLIAYDLDDYDIWRLMIDHRYQGRGFGPHRGINFQIEECHNCDCPQNSTHQNDTD